MLSLEQNLLVTPPDFSDEKIFDASKRTVSGQQIQGSRNEWKSLF